MLHCNTVMKVTNEKKGIFSFYLHNMNKKNSIRVIPTTIDLMFQLKVLIINKNKDTHHKYSNWTLHIVKFFIGFDALVLVMVSQLNFNPSRIFKIEAMEAVSWFIKCVYAFLLTR